MNTAITIEQVVKEFKVGDNVLRVLHGIDVAVRIGDLSDSALHALKVAEVRRILLLQLEEP